MDKLLLSQGETWILDNIFPKIFGKDKAASIAAVVAGNPVVTSAADNALNKAEVWLLDHIFGTEKGNAMIALLQAQGLIAL